LQNDVAAFRPAICAAILVPGCLSGPVPPCPGFRWQWFRPAHERLTL
jgi:hypothetical protein